MASYRVIWSEVADDAYSRLSASRKKKVDQLNATLTSDPKSISRYNRKTDQWTTTTDDGRILITFILSDAVLQVNVLRAQDV
ncbi:hypothetical protein CDG81_02685 [Actinopolyspora erythraea]|uniref:Addiction module toxin RelE n=1 Tax=Actinopolyspora erythraea TaxID=414996 RepID=A0A099D2U7_9ACTN|nr:hypothetical protein [Actinopolyspora erythraea]ASU77388.1 hypothetical protein CDG81_02685 [Actinopolyspora erythraea]KGI80276.1 hypothetical protein IL38_18290 [Actinopolyspora erythraea]